MNSKHQTALTIEADKAEAQYFKDLWNYRELFYILAKRDILVRYKQTAIGVLWAILRPLISMVVFTIVFGKIAKLPSSGTPYPLLVFVGMLPWQFFANSISEGSNSLIASSNMISKVYFPRLIMPISTLIVSMLDLAISFLVLVPLLIYFNCQLTLRIIALPGFIILALLTSIGPSVWLSALTVKYRDFRFVTPFIVQLGMYASPVGFSSEIVPEKYQLIYSLNPMVTVIEGFRWSILGTNNLELSGVIGSLVIALTTLAFGTFYFRKTEKTFADVI